MTKLGGFLFGSLCGAAAVVLIARKKSRMAAFASAAAGRLLSGASKGNGIGSSKGKEGKTEQAANQTQYSSAASSKENEHEVWSRLESIVNSDPEVKKLTGKILDDSVSKLMQSH